MFLVFRRKRKESQVEINKIHDILYKLVIAPATIYVKAVIPAKAEIQNRPGCRIKSGITFDIITVRNNP